LIKLNTRTVYRTVCGGNPRVQSSVTKRTTAYGSHDRLSTSVEYVTVKPLSGSFSTQLYYYRVQIVV